MLFKRYMAIDISWGYLLKAPRCHDFGDREKIFVTPPAMPRAPVQFGLNFEIWTDFLVELYAVLNNSRTFIGRESQI